MKIFESIFGWVSDFIIRTIQAARGDVQYTKNLWTSQLQARRNPYSSCFSHAMAWFLQNNGLQITPDQVTEALNNDPIYISWGRNHYGAATYNSFQSRDLAQMLWELQAKFANDKIGVKNCAIFLQDTSLHDLKQWITRGPIIVNTEPEYQGKKLGHIMLIVGRQDDSWIIDDSFGNFLVGYVGGASGDDVIVPFEDFEKIRGKMSIHYLNKI